MRPRGPFKVSSSLRRLDLDLPEAQRVLVLQMVLKIADLGHLSHPFALHKVLRLLFRLLSVRLKGLHCL